MNVSSRREYKTVKNLYNKVLWLVAVSTVHFIELRATFIGFFRHFKAKKKPSQQAGRYTTLTCHLISIAVANSQFTILAHQMHIMANHHAIKRHVCFHLNIPPQYSVFLGLVCSSPTPNKNI